MSQNFLTFNDYVLTIETKFNKVTLIMEVNVRMFFQEDTVLRHEAFM
jgi:hypothetical protein